MTTREQAIENAAKVIMKQDPCGLMVGGNHVLCCDPVIGEGKDPYGKPFLHKPDDCWCLQSAKAALASLEKDGWVKLSDMSVVKFGEEMAKVGWHLKVDLVEKLQSP